MTNLVVARSRARLVGFVGVAALATALGLSQNAGAEDNETIDIYQCAGGTWHGGSEGSCACHDGYVSVNFGQSCIGVPWGPSPNPNPNPDPGGGGGGGGGGGDGDGDGECSSMKMPISSYVHSVTVNAGISSTQNKTALGPDGTKYTIKEGRIVRAPVNPIINVKVLDYRFYDAATNAVVNLEGMRGRLIHDAAMPDARAVYDLEDGAIYDHAKGEQWFAGHKILFTEDGAITDIKRGHIEGLVPDPLYDFGELVQMTSPDHWEKASDKFNPSAQYGRRVLSPLSVETWKAEAADGEDCPEEETCTGCALKEAADKARAVAFARRCTKGGAQKAAASMCKAEIEVTGKPIKLVCQCYYKDYAPPGSYSLGNNGSTPDSCLPDSTTGGAAFKICGNDFGGCRNRWLVGVGGSASGQGASIQVGPLSAGATDEVTYNAHDGLLQACADTAAQMIITSVSDATACYGRAGGCEM